MSKGKFKRQYRDEAPRFMRWGRFLAVLLIVALVVSGLLYVYRDKAEPMKQSFGLQIQKLKSWLLAHKQKQTPQKIASAKTAENDDQDNVHFEFYTTLQTMHVNTSAPQEQVKADSKKPASLKHIFVSSDELEKDFASKLKGKSG